MDLTNENNVNQQPERNYSNIPLSGNSTRPVNESSSSQNQNSNIDEGISFFIQNL